MKKLYTAWIMLTLLPSIAQAGPKASENAHKQFVLSLSDRPWWQLSILHASIFAILYAAKQLQLKGIK